MYINYHKMYSSSDVLRLRSCRGLGKHIFTLSKKMKRKREIYAEQRILENT
jgi:hypothetical protein